MIKCFVCDLDGTLLNKQHTLGKFHAEVIQKVQSSGYRFMIATGRSWESVEPLLKPYGITCRCLLLNGAIVQDEQANVIAETPLDYERVKRIIAVIEKYDVNIQLYTKEGTATPHPERIKEDFKLRMMQMEQKSAEEVEAMMNENGFFNFHVLIEDWDSYFAKNPIIYKMEAFSNDDEKMGHVREELTEIEHIDISDSIGKNFELTDVHAQKGLILEKEIKALGYTKEEVAVFGDSMNDYLMMKQFPYSFALENASDAIKEVAGYQIGHHDDNAVGKEILRIMKEQEH